MRCFLSKIWLMIRFHTLYVDGHSYKEIVSYCPEGHPHDLWLTDCVCTLCGRERTLDLLKELYDKD